jgi:hypothetical protein
LSACSSARATDETNKRIELKKGDGQDRYIARTTYTQ